MINQHSSFLWGHLKFILPFVSVFFMNLTLTSSYFVKLHDWPRYQWASYDAATQSSSTKSAAPFGSSSVSWISCACGSYSPPWISSACGSSSPPRICYVSGSSAVTWISAISSPVAVWATPSLSLISSTLQPGQTSLSSPSLKQSSQWQEVVWWAMVFEERPCCMDLHGALHRNFKERG